MAGRMYSVSFDQVAVSVAQDLLNITATASMAFRVHRIELGQRTLATWEAKPVRLIRMPATVTAGSGGSAVTISKMNNGDAAPTITARANDTTAMTTSGTPAIILARDWEFLNGLLVVFTPDERPIIAPSQGLALNLPVAPSGSMTASGSIIVEELF